MTDIHNLQRFVDAQAPVIQQVHLELSQGRKQSHWMWFIFPQLKGLGHSAMAHNFGISSQEEAQAYLRHPILGPRLQECTRLVNLIEGRSIERIFGYPDHLKFHSSMTLFAHATTPNEIFTTALQKYFEGKSDPATTAMLNPSRSRAEM